MPSHELADRIAGFLQEQESGADATTIARDFLRLTDPAGTAAATLVRAVLARDARFLEGPPGFWRLVGPPGTALAPPVLLGILDVPARATREPWLWRVSTLPWGEEGPVLQHRGPARSEALVQMLQAMGSEPVATDRVGALARWIGAQERLHALPEIDPVRIDLRAWAALLQIGSPQAESARDPSGESEACDGSESDRARATERLAALARRLEHVVEAARPRGLRTWEEVAQAPRLARERARAEVWEAPRAIAPEAIESLPEEPGIYRFFARDHSLLYVGKSRDLRRRVTSYFQPPDRRATRREALLREIHRLEVEPTGSELEALIRESQEITRRRPSWNVQVRLDPEPPEFPLGERDLLLMLPGAAGALSLFLLAGTRVGLCRLLSAPEAPDLARVLREFYTEVSSPDGVEEIPAPERGLVRRWMSWEPRGTVILRLVDYATFQQLAEAVARCAALPVEATRDAELPIVVRGEGTRARDA